MKNINDQIVIYQTEDGNTAILLMSSSQSVTAWKAHTTDRKSFIMPYLIENKCIFVVAKNAYLRKKNK